MHDNRQLTDTERKVVRVLVALYKTKPAALDLGKVCRMTQRRPGDVLKAIRALADTGRVSWDAKTRVVQVHWAEVLMLPEEMRLPRAKGERIWGTWPD
ncbi:MAG: hypothetical protein J7559_18705 [Cohnella sp.]|nr:hypothetical protein [Cohnella sp.]